jgi:hypothetical protein
VNEFEKLQHEKKIEARKKKCVTCSGVLTLPKAKIRSFYEAMLDRNISADVISTVLGNWGVDSSPTTINNHRRGKDSYGEHMAQIKKAAGVE